MKKQVVKGITMLTMIVAIAFATAVVSAQAQSGKTVISNIPFEFVVADQTLPAGKYQVNRSIGNALAISTSDAAVFRLTNEIEPSKDRRARLVFHRYGNRYFLAEAWTGAGEAGRQLLKSRQERAIEREMSTLASKLEQGECGPVLVEVAAVLR
ncbi:MAG TPA: hypothetical protein VJU84_19405 [Pyrinomonadaceae bacterium]|nr:hypothetical protein [Pyrinomonadaceae bacterium]